MSPSLTPTENRVYQLLVSSDMPQKLIAEKLGVELGTVRKHAENIYAKLRVNSRVELIMRRGPMT